MLSLNFMQSGCADGLSSIDVDDEAKWVALANVYPEILAKETIKTCHPTKEKAFLPDAGSGTERLSKRS